MNGLKLKGYLLNFIINFLYSFFIGFILIKGKNVLAFLLFLILIIYNILGDVLFPSIGNIKIFKKQERKKKKLVINLIYVFLYLVILFFTIFFHPLFLILLGILFSIDVILLIVKSEKLISLLIYD